MGMNVSSGATSGRRSRRAPMAEINVTPFVDVMLVLLIIFMVTAPLLVAGVPVNLPESSAKPLEQQKDPIEVAIDQDGIIYIDGDEIAPNQLATSFAAITAKDEESEEKSQILLRGDKDINYGRVVLVMGELNAAGLNQISLITGPIASDAIESESTSETSQTSVSEAKSEANISQSDSDTSVTDGSSSVE